MKQTSRRVKNSTYKELLSNCKAYDYDEATDTIMVVMPEDVLTNKEFLPSGWKTKYTHDGISILKTVRDGIAVYSCSVRGSNKTFLNYRKAVSWCLKMLKNCE